MRWMVISKKGIIYCTLIFLFVIGSFAVSANKIAEVASAPKKLPIYSVGREDKKISISFDAAWGNEDTQTLIEILAKYNVKATFFLVGQWADKYPESVKALFDAGHEIQNHSNTHKHMPKLTREEIIADLAACSDKIEAITKVRPILFRPPYGDYDNKLIETLENENYYCIQWDVDSLDWKDPEPDKLCQTVLKKVKPGSIVLFHNAAKNTPAALPQIIEKLLSEGYEFVKISELIYKDNFTIDHSGKQLQTNG